MPKTAAKTIPSIVAIAAIERALPPPSTNPPHGWIEWKDYERVTKTGEIKRYPQAWYHWSPQHYTKRCAYIPKRKLQLVEAMIQAERPRDEILELLGKNNARNNAKSTRRKRRTS